MTGTKKGKGNEIPMEFHGFPIVLYPVENQIDLAERSENKFVLLMNFPDYKIERARSFILFIKSINKSFDLIITSRQGSEATLLSCAAQSVYMTQRASVAPLDPTYPSHGFPTVVENDCLYPYNPDEKNALVNFITNSFQKDSVQESNSLSSFLFFPSYQELLANLLLSTWRHFLTDLLATKLSLEQARDVVDFLTTGCGSADSLITATALKERGFPIEQLHTQDEKLLRWRGQQNDAIEFMQWNW